MSSAERPLKKEEPFRDDRRKTDAPVPSPRGGNPAHRSGPAPRGVHPLHPPPGLMGPPGSRGGSGSHKDIKLTLLNKVNVAAVAMAMEVGAEVDLVVFVVEAAAGRQEQEEVPDLGQEQARLPPQQEDGLLSGPSR